MNKRRLTIIKILLAVLAFGYLFQSGRLTVNDITALFSLSNIPFLMISGAAYFAVNVLAAMRLVYLLRTIRFPLSLVQSLKVTLIGIFFNSVIPGMTGGDIIKGYYLFKSEGREKGKSSGIVILDRVMGLFSIVFIAGVSALYLLYFADADLGQYAHTLRVIASAVLFICPMGIVLLVLAASERFRQRIGGFVRSLLGNGVIYRALEGAAGIFRYRNILFRSFVLSLMIQMITLAGILVLARMIGSGLSQAVLLMVASSIVLLLGVIPVTPGNIGWTELLGSFGWSLVGSPIGGVVFLYWRLVGILSSSLPGAVLYAFQSNPVHEIRDPSGPAA